MPSSDGGSGTGTAARALRSTDASITGITRLPIRKRQAKSRFACSNSGAMSIHSTPSANRKSQSEDTGSWRSRGSRTQSAYIHSMTSRGMGPWGSRAPRSVDTAPAWGRRYSVSAPGSERGMSHIIFGCPWL